MALQRAPRPLRSKMEKQYAPTASEKKQMNAPVQNPIVKSKETLADVRPEDRKHLLPVKESKDSKPEQAHEHINEHKAESQDKEKKSDTQNVKHKAQDKVELKDNVEKKEAKAPKIAKKDEAIAHGSSIRASKKASMYICDFIKNKPIDLAVSQLQEVIKMKRAIPFKGEIPHRHGKGMMSGRYPINVSKIFINILKGLKGNVIVNGMDLDKTRIAFASASWASRPQRAGGVRAKRTNVILKAREATNIKEAKK